jgi:DNA-binding NtrC family response regulator
LFGHEPGAFTGATKLRIGRLEQAHSGTLFLDDVDDIPLEMQVKLLRALQERTFERVGGEEAIRVNIRVVAATKKDLAAMATEGTFRDDLFYRLNVVPLHVPPLRERKEDIGLLAEHFLERSAAKLNRGNLSISPAAVAKLRSYHWPGNVREFQHLIERMVALSTKPRFDADDVPDFAAVHNNTKELVSVSLEGMDSIDMASILAETEARLVRWAMERASGNLAKACEMLGIPRSTLQYRLSKLDPSISSSTPEDQ